MADETEPSTTLALTAGIVAAHVRHNQVGTAELPQLIRSVHDALAQLGQPAPEPTPEAPRRAVTVRKSLADPAKIISMIDGKGYTTLTRHLTARGYTPDRYRGTFGLPRDYPMVAPAYAEKRREMAKTHDFGRKTLGKVAQQAEVVAAKAVKAVKRVAKRVRKG